MLDNPAAVTALATAGFAVLWFLARDFRRLSAIVFVGLLVNFIFVILFFSPYFSNIVIGKDIAAQVIGFGLFLLWVSHLFEKNGFALTVTPLNVAVLVYLLAGVLSAFLAPRWTWYYSLEEISRTAVVVLVFFMTIKFLHTRARWNAGLNVILICLALTSIYTVLQVAGYDFVNWGFKTNVSTFGNKDFFASFLTYTLPVALFLAIGGTLAFDRALYLGLAALAFYNIVQGETRGAWVGLMALAVVTVWYELTLGRLKAILNSAKKKLAFFAGLVAVGFVAVSFTPEHKIRTFQSIFQTHSGTNIIRVYIWWSSMRMWWDQPLIGQGIGTYQLTYPNFRPDRYHRIGMSHNTRHAHSEQLEILSEQGMIGFSAWAAVMIIFFYLGAKKLRQIGPLKERYLFYGLLSGLFAGLVHDSINVNLRWMSSSVTFWSMLALATRYLIGFDPAPESKPVRAKPAVSTSGLSWRSAALGAAVTVIFAFLFWIQYLVLRTDYLLRIVEGTVEHPTTQRLGIEKGIEVIRMQPYEHSAYYKTAYAYLRQNEIANAKKMYAWLLSLAPNYAQIHQNTALIAYSDYTTLKQKKYLYQAALEFEWATLLENHFENHTKMMQVYTQLLNDTSRSRYHNRYIFWQILEDSFFSHYRLWNVFYLYTNRSARQYQEMHDYYLKEPADYARQYWLYRTDSVQNLNRPTEELRYAIKMSVRFVPGNLNLTTFAVRALLQMRNPSEDLVYLINIMEYLKPGEASPELLRLIRENLATQSVPGEMSPLMAYALGVVSHQLGERNKAAEYFQAARSGETQFRMIRRGIKQYGG